MSALLHFKCVLQTTELPILFIYQQVIHMNKIFFQLLFSEECFLCF